MSPRKDASAPTPEDADLKDRLARVEALLKKARSDARINRADARRARREADTLKSDLLQERSLKSRLASANASGAEIMAEVEGRNESLREANLQLAAANANAAELIAMVSSQEEEIRALNRSISQANAQGAELIADRELRMEEMEHLNRKLLKEIDERTRAEQENAMLTERLRQANEELDRLATIDALTELHNRRGLERQLQTELLRLARNGNRMGVLLADFDDFKSINERFGHAGGDVALQAIAHRLSDIVRGTDVLGRIGGDEFMALVPDIDGPGLVEIAERLRTAACDKPVPIGNEPVAVTLSIGGAMVPPDVTSIDGLLRLTREGLGASKSLGKNRVHVIHS